MMPTPLLLKGIVIRKRYSMTSAVCLHQHRPSNYSITRQRDVFVIQG